MFTFGTRCALADSERANTLNRFGNGDPVAVGLFRIVKGAISCGKQGLGIGAMRREGGINRAQIPRVVILGARGTRRQIPVAKVTALESIIPVSTGMIPCPAMA